MSVSRASINALGKLLSAAAEPFYVVAADGQIVFVNDVCAAWLGVEANEIVGAQCRYSAAVDESPAATVAASLCPPPEAFAGKRMTAPCVWPSMPPGEYQTEFEPLQAADSTWLIVAIVRSDAAAHRTETTQSAALHARLQHYRQKLATRYHIDRLLGDSPAMQRVRTQAKLASASSASVLVTGPPGSRREHVGRAIHHGDASHQAGPLVPLACPLLDADLLQAALRSVARSKPGELRPATLLLNDVDLLPEGAQTDLARSLSGSRFAARIVSTARSPLAELAVAGKFRADLACLLSTLSIELPALTDRLADLPLLAQWYLEQANARAEKQIAGCSPEVLDRLANHPWSNDLAELEELVAAAHEQAQGPLIGLQDLPPRLTLAAEALARPTKTDERIVLEEYLAQIEHELIVRALKRAKGNKTRAARLLGMTRPRFYRRLVQLGLAEPEPGEPPAEPDQ